MSGRSRAQLGEVANFVRGITFKPEDVVRVGGPDTVACMRTKNVQTELDLSDVWGLPRRFLARADQRLARGDILVSTANSWNLVGKCCWVPDLPWTSTFGGFISVLRVRNRTVDARYLYHWFSWGHTQEEVRNCARQTTNIANLSTERTLRLELPLPPLPEQRRIAAILDQADALRVKRRASIAQLDTLAQSIFLDMFGDLASNSKGWSNSQTLGDVAEIVSGITKGRKLNGHVTRTVPYLAVVNVQDRRLDLSVLKTIEATDEEIRRYRLARNDLLLTEGGDPDKLGRGTLWNDELPECIHQNHIFRVRLTSIEITPIFLNWLVGSGYGKRYFLRSAKQTTGIATINSTQLRSFPLTAPPLSLQQQFSDRIARLETLKERHLGSLAHIDELFASLQHRAFRGELERPTGIGPAAGA